MNKKHEPGLVKTYITTVTDDKLAAFEAGLVHPVYSTFALGRDVEWACRQFVLEMKDDSEEGVGSYLSIEHLSPALLGSEVVIHAKLIEVNGNEIVCEYEAFVDQRMIARGLQKQRILNKVRFDRLLQKLQK